METKHLRGFSQLLNFNMDDQNLSPNFFDPKSPNTNNLDIFSQQILNDANMNFMFPDKDIQSQQQSTFNNLDINEALMGFQDLDLPTEISNYSQQLPPPSSPTKTHSSQPSFRRHAKKPSGAALFGFHGRELSIPGMNPIDFGDIMNNISNSPTPSTYSSPSKEKNNRRLNKIIDPKATLLSKDYIITNNKPTSYKFPPEPEDEEKELISKRQEIKNQMEYDQLTMLENNEKTINYSMFNNHSEICFPTPGSSTYTSPIKSTHGLSPQPPSNYIANSLQRTTPDLKPQSQPPIYSTPSPRLMQFQNQIPGSYPVANRTYNNDIVPIYETPAKESDWSNMMPNESTPKPKRKGADKVSTLPPGYIDQFIIGPDEAKRYICNYNGCGKLFQRRYNIRSHIQTHLCDRPYNCSFDGCNKSFVRQHDLHRHEKIHENNKFSCLCGKGFTRVDALRRHKERNICVGGIDTGATINKPKKKRGRPKKITEITDKLVLKLEQTVENDNDRFIKSFTNYEEEDKENSLSGSLTSSAKSSAPMTPINGQNRQSPLTMRQQY